MRQAQQSRLRVCVVAELTSEACGVMLPDACPRRTFVGLAQGPIPLKRRAVIRRKAAGVGAVRVPLLNTALRVIDELVDDAALLPGPPAVRSHGVQCCERGCCAAEGFFGNGRRAVVDKVGGDACRCLFGPQTVAIIGRAKGGAADGRQAVFGVERECRRFVGGRVADKYNV